MAFVRKRGRAWRVRFVDERGVQVERATKATTKTEAQRMGDDLERRAERVRLGLETAVMAITVSRAYEDHYKPVVQGRGGFAAMDSRFRLHILPALGEKLVNQVKPSDVLALLALKEREGYSEQTREHIRVETSGLFTYVIEHLKAFAGENPAREVPKVVIPEKPPKSIAAHVDALLGSVVDEWRGLVAFGVYTGARWSEARGVRVSDVDLERRLVAIWWTSTGSTKTRKVRHVPIADELVPFLKVELGRVRSEFLFPGNDGDQLSKDFPINDVIRRALKWAGVAVGFDHVCRTRGKGKGCGYLQRRADSAESECPKCGRHLEVVTVPPKVCFKDLRSTFATQAAESTGDLRVVQKALGHADPRTTERRYAFARDRYFVEKLAGLSFQQPARQAPAGEGENGRRAAKVAGVVRLRKPSNSEEVRGETNEGEDEQTA